MAKVRTLSFLQPGSWRRGGKDESNRRADRRRNPREWIEGILCRENIRPSCVGILIGAPAMGFSENFKSCFRAFDLRTSDRRCIKEFRRVDHSERGAITRRDTHVHHVTRRHRPTTSQAVECSGDPLNETAAVAGRPLPSVGQVAAGAGGNPPSDQLTTLWGPATRSGSSHGA